METRPICDISTLESNIVQIRTNPDDILIRRALGKPCVSPYMPWYLGLKKSPPSFEGIGHENALLSHFSPAASDFDYSRASGWSYYTDLHTVVELSYAKVAEDVRNEILDFEKELELRVSRFENTKKTGRAYDSFVNDVVLDTLSALSAIYARQDVAPAQLAGAEEPYMVCLDNTKSLVVRLDKNTDNMCDVVIDKTFFGPSYIPVSKWLKAVRAERSSGGVEIEFHISDESAKDLVPCLNDMWLLAEDKNGERMIGQMLVSFKKTAN